MLSCGSQTQRPNSRCRLCLSKDTFSQIIQLTCLVYTFGCQMLCGSMSDVNCTKALRTNNSVRPMMRLSIATMGRPPFRGEEGAKKFLRQHRPCDINFSSPVLPFDIPFDMTIGSTYCPGPDRSYAYSSSSFCRNRRRIG
jgi:hypothetical protein